MEPKGGPVITVGDVDLGMLLALAARTAIVLVALIVGLRLFGRRQAGEMRTMDILVVLVMANAVQNSMTKSDGHLIVSLVSAGTLILVGWFLGTIVRLRPRLESTIGGEPAVLIYDGSIVRENLRRQGVTVEDVLTAVRQQGLTEVADVKLAVLEMDGSISVVPYDESGKD